MERGGNVLTDVLNTPSHTLLLHSGELFFYNSTSSVVIVSQFGSHPQETRVSGYFRRDGGTDLVTDRISSESYLSTLFPFFSFPPSTPLVRLSSVAFQSLSRIRPELFNCF